MKIIGRLTILAIIVIAGVCWAVSNPNKANAVKETTAAVIETAKDAVTD